MQIHEDRCKQHSRILLVDDNQSVRDMLYNLLNQECYQCIIAKDVQEAEQILSKSEIDLVISDIVMPGKESGLDLAQKVKQSYDSEIILMTGYVDEFSFDKIVGMGVSDFIPKPISSTSELLMRIKQVLIKRLSYKERDKAEEKLKNNIESMKQLLTGVVNTLSKTVDVRDPYTAGHQRRVAKLATLIAQELGLSEKQVMTIEMSGLMHDLGKLAIPQAILSKPHKLSELEFGLIKTHSQVGYDLLKNIKFPWPIAEIVLQHHEKLDGSGYPQGITGEEMLFESKVLCVADVVEAMGSHRPYRPALGVDVALEEITDKKEKLFDSRVVEACKRLFRERNYCIEDLESNGDLSYYISQLEDFHVETESASAEEMLSIGNY